LRNMFDKWVKCSYFPANSRERGLHQRGVMPVKIPALADMATLPGQQRKKEPINGKVRS
jgi:hypothetical protein